MIDSGDEALPAHIGTPHPSIDALVLKELVGAVAYLRKREEWEKLSGLWREIVGEIAPRCGSHKPDAAV